MAVGRVEGSFRVETGRSRAANGIPVHACTRSRGRSVDAIRPRGEDDARLARARSAVLEKMGAAALVDAAGVAGLFNAIDRVADATGTPLEEWKAEQSEDLRDELRINDFAGAGTALGANAASSTRRKPSTARS